MGYWDLDDILMGEESVACVFQVQAVGMGQLDSSCHEPDLPEGSKVDLPLWLGQAMNKKRAVTVELPKHYSLRFRQQLKAGAVAVSLREKSPFYYEIGGILAGLRGDTDLKLTLLETYGTRLQQILDVSLNSQHEDIADFTRSLPHTEKLLFDVGYNTSAEYNQWKSRQNSKLAAARGAGPSSKRRRVS